MSETEKKNTKITIIVAVIGFFGTILAALLPVIIEKLGDKPLEPTATITQTALSETPIVVGSTHTPTSTLTAFPPTSTETPMNEATPVTPPLDCLDRWLAFSSSIKLLPAPQGSGNCGFVTDSNLGIGAGRDGLVFAVTNFKEKGVFGISTPLPRNATIRLTVGVTQLTEGEFWIAFDSDLDPQENAIVFAIQPDTGDVHSYIGRTTSASAYYLWSTIRVGQPSSPAGVNLYAFELVFDGNRVDLFMNGISFDSVVSPAWERLFLGYRSIAQSIGTGVNVEVTGLSVEGE